MTMSTIKGSKEKGGPPTSGSTTINNRRIPNIKSVYGGAPVCSILQASKSFVFGYQAVEKWRSDQPLNTRGSEAPRVFKPPGLRASA